jgi:hypothetical protein
MQKELTLPFADGFVDFLADLRLQLGDFNLFFQENARLPLSTVFFHP